MPGIMEKKRIARLTEAIRRDREDLKPFRQILNKVIDDYLGSHYHENSGAEVPINLIGLFLTIYQRLLAPNVPRVKTTTNIVELKPLAYDIEIGLNRNLEEIRYGEVMKEIALDALLSMAIVKTGLTQKEEIDIMGDDEFLDVGQPYAICVSLDDWVHDMNATRFSEVTYAGHRYYIPFERAMDSRQFEAKARDQLKPIQRFRGNETGEDRIEDKSRRQGIDIEGFVSQAEVWELWIPDTNSIVTLPSDDQGLPFAGAGALREVEYKGPEGGPYDLLGFFGVPNNSMPLSAVAHLLDLHSIANDIWLKLSDQAEREKSVLLTNRRGAKDVEFIVELDDGSAASVDDPGGSKEVRFGGINQTSLAFFLQVFEQFNFQAGNLEVVGGFGAAAETLGQEQIISSSASEKVVDLQEKMIIHSKRIIEKLAYYFVNDPLLDVEIVKPIGKGHSRSRLTADKIKRQEADFLQFNFDIDVYSMQHKTPQSRLQAMLTVYREIIAPSLPLIPEFNMKKFIEKVSELSDLPELMEVMDFDPTNVQRQQIIGEQTQSEGAPAFKTSRTENVRRNVPGATRSGKSDVMQRLLMGSGVQGSEAASLFGPGGG